jgi:hypothetical protein
MGKSLQIQVSAGDLEALRAAGYSLCLAKPVQGNLFSMVWYAYTVFVSTNVFSWTPEYQIFATRAFTPDEVVTESMSAISLGLGQQCTLDGNGILSLSGASNSPNALTMINHFPGIIFPGINQRATGIDGKSDILPNFVTNESVVPGVITLTPVESIMVWFEQKRQNGTMFRDPPPLQGGSLHTEIAMSFAAVVDFTQADGQSITYCGGAWQQPVPWINPNPP